MNGGQTEKEAQCLAFITEEVVRSGGVSPSYREIAAGLRCGSSCSVRLVEQLVSKGALRKGRGGSRTLEVVGLDLSASPPPVSAALLMVNEVGRMAGDLA